MHSSFTIFAPNVRVCTRVHLKLIIMSREQIAVYISLLASVLLLLSVIVPHHHHDNGMPCYHWIASDVADEPLTEDSEHHDCGCVGHNQALSPALEYHAVSDLYLIPLLVLFNYINPFSLIVPCLTLDLGKAFYVESLYDSWIIRISGLRAPPALISGPQC